jgi:hypothetical protein
MAVDIKQTGVSRDTLCLKCESSCSLEKRWKIVDGRLIAYGSICLPTNEGKIRDVVGVAGCTAVLENRLWENMMKLQAMLRS